MFDPLKFKPEYKYIEVHISKYLKRYGSKALIGRDDLIAKINNVIAERNVGKYRPIIISTSRGMGKSALMAAVGLQHVKKELENELIRDALDSGRVITFDFSLAWKRMRKEADIYHFFTNLMINELCRMFQDRMVDGILFRNMHNDVYGERFEGELKEWYLKVSGLSVDLMMDEYIRLTNIAFGVDCNAP